MDDLADFRDDPNWLQLPAERRHRALRRLEAIREYKGRGGGTAEAARAAAAAGTSLRLFYQMLADWDAAGTKTIWPLVPYAPRKGPSKTKLDADVEAILHDLIRTAIAEGTKRPSAIVDRVAELWPQDGPPPPSPQTIRLHAESAGGFEILERGTFKLNTGRHAQEEAETATRHGEVLVVDHSGLELFLDNPLEPRRATATFAIDLFTATVAGFAIRVGEPDAKAVIDAMDDAERRTADCAGPTVVPRLMFAATSGRPWRDLADEVARRGLTATVRWGSRLHSGGPTKRIIGSRVADLPLSPRKPHPRSASGDAFDPARHALVTPEQARLVVEDAVRRMNTERLAPGAIMGRIVTRTL